jgi:hypothetical protein
MDVTFAPSWETGHEGGLSLNADEGQGSDFVLRAPAPVDHRRSTGARTVQSFAAARSADLDFALEIRRNGRTRAIACIFPAFFLGNRRRDWQSAPFLDRH